MQSENHQPSEVSNGETPSIDADTVWLICKYQTGDRNALERLFERYTRRVKLIVAFRMRRPVSSLAEHDDIVQEALTKAYCNLDAFNTYTQGTFIGYLVKCVRSAILNAARRESARRAFSNTQLLD